MTIRPEETDPLASWLTLTPARLDVGRAGARPLTEEMLRFRLDHAEAVDAVYSQVRQDTLDAFGLFTVETQAADKAEYLQFPGKGRSLTPEGEALLRKACPMAPQVQVVVSDGLSARAVDEQLPDILPALRDSLAANGLSEGTAFFVQRGRVGVMDDIGRILRPEVLVLFIGERPGLAASASMSAYMCYRPGPGKRDADRNVISNIHRSGTPPVEAGAHIGSILRKMLEQRRSGVQLEL